MQQTFLLQILLLAQQNYFLHFYSTKYHRQQPLYNTLELLMMGIVMPETRSKSYQTFMAYVFCKNKSITTLYRCLTMLYLIWDHLIYRLRPLFQVRE